MLIKKDEIVTFMHGFFGERDRPMVAVKEFDLDVVIATLTEGMDVYDCQSETYIIIERLEDMGLMRPVPQTLIRFNYEDERLTIQAEEEEPRITDRPV